jgi:hypothetical protein
MQKLKAQEAIIKPLSKERLEHMFSFPTLFNLQLFWLDINLFILQVKLRAGGSQV